MISNDIEKLNLDSNDDKNANYLQSQFSSIDFNSGLFIKIDTLTYNQANVFIVAYEFANLIIKYEFR